MPCEIAAVRSAVFTTFNFDPGFFELQVLPLLFSQSFSQVDKVRLLQLEDALRDIDHLAVYYDGSALSQDAEPARLDYQRIDVHRTTGVFHPKLAFLLVEETLDDGHVYPSLIVACFSANLTRGGWWENVECGHIEEIRDRKVASNRNSYRQDLFSLIGRIRGSGNEEDDHSALDAVHRFLKERSPVGKPVQNRAGGRWYTRLFGGCRWFEPLTLGGFSRV